MVLIDTSVWVDVLRGGASSGLVHGAVAGREIALTRFNQLELLQGSRNESEWSQLKLYLEDQQYLTLSADGFWRAARIYYDCRRRGLTVRSPIDCCIAQVAIEHRVELLHRDKDFDAIAQVRPELIARWAPAG